MKKFFSFLIAGAILVGGGLATGCSDNETDPTAPRFSVKTAAVDMNSVTLNVNQANLEEIAYLVFPAAEAPAEAPLDAVIFVDGAKVAPADILYIDGLLPETGYVIYLAASTPGNEYFEKVLKVEATTTALEGDAPISVLGVSYDGYKMLFRLPADVKERGNVLRYSTTDLCNYMQQKMGWFPQSDADLLSFNAGQIFGAEGETSKVVEINNDNIYLKDENGEYILDEYSGKPMMLHYPVTPGEPVLFMAGEFTHTEDEWTLEYYGDWFTPLFDYNAYWGGGDDWAWAPKAITPIDNSLVMDEDQYWTGYFSRNVFKVKSPEPLDLKLNLEVTDVTALDAKIRITPDEGIYQYSVYIIDDETYQTTILPMLGNDASLMQWFITSYTGYLAGSGVYEGNFEVSLREQYYSDAETTYHVFATGVSDETLGKQCFETATFTTKPKTHPAPVVVVTPIDAPEGEVASPFEVWFNVKCTSKNAVRGYYAANYIDPWVKENNNYTPNSSLIPMGNRLQSGEIEMINSDEGMDVMFTTLEGMTTRLGVMLYNDEETPNDVDSEETTAVADATAGYLPDAARVESTLFDDLVGEWTMTASAVDYDWYSGAWAAEPHTVTTTVTISNGVTYPETLSDEVYAANEGMSKEEVDALFDAFKADADAYNARLRGQNRLLCLGFNSEGEQTQPLSAFEAFYAPNYSCFDNATLLHDFGPKWYLEIAEGDKVSAPFNSVRFAPMNQASTYYAAYMAAISLDDEGYMVNYDENGNAVATMYFPVEATPEKITVKAMTVENDDSEYYPNVCYYGWSGTSIMGPKYISELTLVPAEDAVATVAPAAVTAKNFVAAQKVLAGKKLALQQKSRTSFLNAKHYKRAEYKVIRTEELKANFIKRMEARRAARK